MPPKKSNNDDVGAAAFSHDYTDGELQLMIAIIKRIDSPANLDADAIASEIGSASGASVRKRISNAVAKRGWYSGGAPAAVADAEGAPPATTPVKKPRAKRAPKNKKAPEDEGENGDEGDEQGAPKKKKARTTKAKAKAQSEEENPVKGEDDEGAKGQF